MHYNIAVNVSDTVHSIEHLPHPVNITDSLWGWIKTVFVKKAVVCQMPTSLIVEVWNYAVNVGGDCKEDGGSEGSSI